MNACKIAFIGAGNMANSLIRGLLAKGFPATDLLACDVDTDKLQSLRAECGIRTGGMAEVAADADVLLLAVKPQVMAAVCTELAPLLSGHPRLVISIAAGIPLSSLQSWLGSDVAIVRCMPNTPALVSAGATGLYANQRTTEDQQELAGQIMESVGIVCWLTRESDIDTVTALSGSGPAYFFLLMEAMESAAVRLGLEKDVAQRLTLQTALGAALLATQSNVAPAELRRRVTSPGGTTEQALNTFARKEFSAIVDEAVQAACRRSEELAKSFS